MKKYLFGMSGASSPNVVLGPALGVDFGVVKLGDRDEEKKNNKKKKEEEQGRYLIVSSDPITGVRERAGWYAVNVSANDVATSGNRPDLMQSVILLPEDAAESDVDQISTEMDRTAKALGISIVGGHTELTPGLRRPIVVTTAFAIVNSYVTAAGARDGDSLMMTKTAGVEGTAILAMESPLGGRVSRETLVDARRYLEHMSVVEEAVAAYKTGVVHAMHDCTEGGVLGAICEMAAASGFELEVNEESIPISGETSRICSVLGVDPMKLISSGTLLIAVERNREKLVEDAVRSAGSRATVIGRFCKEKRGRTSNTTSSRGIVLLKDREGAVREIRRPPNDEIWRLHEVPWASGVAKKQQRRSSQAARYRPSMV